MAHDKQQPSHKQMILNRLVTGATITPLEALYDFGCFRLAARIAELRSDGWHVITVTGKESGKQFAVYSLDRYKDRSRIKTFIKQLERNKGK